MRLMRGVGILAIALAASGALSRRAAAQLAVITNPGTNLPALSLDDLRRLFLGQTTRTGGTRVLLIDTAPARGAFYRAVAQMSEAQVDRAWLAVVFQGGDATPPRKFPTAEEARRFVAEHPGAIGFIPLEALDASVKVVAINGFTPRQPGYPIR
jgi:hypothetical protein